MYTYMKNFYWDITATFDIFKKYERCDSRLRNTEVCAKYVIPYIPNQFNVIYFALCSANFLICGYRVSNNLALFA